MSTQHEAGRITKPESSNKESSCETDELTGSTQDQTYLQSLHFVDSQDDFHSCQSSDEEGDQGSKAARQIDSKETPNDQEIPNSLKCPDEFLYLQGPSKEAGKAFTQIDNILLSDEFLTEWRLTTFYTNLDPLNVDLPPYRDIKPIIVNSLMINITGLQMLLVQEIPKELTTLLKAVIQARKSKNPLRIMAVLGKADLRQLAGIKHTNSDKALEILRSVEKFMKDCEQVCYKENPQTVYFGTGGNDSKAPWYFLSSKIHKELRDPGKTMKIICHDLDEGLKPFDFSPRASFRWNKETIYSRIRAITAYAQETDPRVNPIWKYCVGIGPQYRAFPRTPSFKGGYYHSSWYWNDSPLQKPSNVQSGKQGKNGKTHVYWRRIQP